MSKRTLIIKYCFAVIIFIFIMSANFYLNDFSAWVAQRQWQDLPFSLAFKNYITNQNIYMGYAYALSGTFAYLCLFNLVTASGDLNKSIKGVSLSAILWFLICFLTGCCGSPMLSVYLSLFGSRFLGITKPLVAGMTTVSILFSFYYVIRFQNRNLLFGNKTKSSLAEHDNPFQKIKEYHPGIYPIKLIRHFLMTLFRLFPAPSPIGLYSFGNPDRNAPILVTSNYSLTFDRVADVLKDLNCYLLVAEGKGINVWCSAGAGYFNVENIVTAIKQSNLEDIVDHRTIILPQFAAPGVCIQELKQKTEWSFSFGPAYIVDFPAYIQNSFTKSEDMSLARFDIRQRIEMAIGCTLIGLVAVICIMTFVNASALLILIPLLYFQSILFGIIEPYIYRYWLITGGIYALLWGGIVFIISHLCFELSYTASLIYAIPLLISGFYLPNEFMGWSPLLKYNWQVLLKGVWKADISVDQDKCIGCNLCIDVCPTSVFELNNRKSTLKSPERCEGCKACFIQCPVDAISHSLKSEEDSCACIFCGVQNNLK